MTTRFLKVLVPWPRPDLLDQRNPLNGPCLTKKNMKNRRGTKSLASISQKHSENQLERTGISGEPSSRSQENPEEHLKNCGPRWTRIRNTPAVAPPITCGDAITCGTFQTGVCWFHRPNTWTWLATVQLISSAPLRVSRWDTGQTRNTFKFTSHNWVPVVSVHSCLTDVF